MSDLISRQAAIDRIQGTGYADAIKNNLMLILRLLPSAQPEIIRCKDCKHRYVDGVNVRFNVCELNHNRVQADDWYCADAERWEE